MLKLLKLWQALGDRMDVHKNARLTPAGREIMVRRVVEGGQTPKALSAAVGVCPRTVQKWVKRFRAEGLAGLQDRSSRPHRLRRPTPPEITRRIDVCIDDASRIAFAQVMPDEKKESAIAFLRAALT